MNDSVVSRILRKASNSREKDNFINWFFGKSISSVKKNTPIVLYGTGGLASDLYKTLKRNNIDTECFCKTEISSKNEIFFNLPVISLEELKTKYKKSLVVIASLMYAGDIKKLLLKNKFEENQIVWPHDFDLLSAQFLTDTCQVTLMHNIESFHLKLEEDSKKIEKAYNLLGDNLSKKVFIEKLAIMLNPNNIKMFKKFIKNYSEPLKKFGIMPYKDGGGENFFYFSNDIYSLRNDEIYMDVGAFWGDTIIEFINACKMNEIDYKQIYAFEPDPSNYKDMLKNTKNYQNITLEQKGIYSSKEILRFASSLETNTDGGASLSEEGSIEVQTISIDEYLKGREITLLKMDPPGDIIIHALNGAKKTLKEFQPKLALGAYHSFDAIYKIPLHLNSINPNYKIFLRHNSWYIGETDVLAYVPLNKGSS